MRLLTRIGRGRRFMLKDAQSTCVITTFFRKTHIDPQVGSHVRDAEPVTSPVSSKVDAIGAFHCIGQGSPSSPQWNRWNVCLCRIETDARGMKSTCAARNLRLLPETYTVSVPKTVTPTMDTILGVPIRNGLWTRDTSTAFQLN